MEVMWSCFLVLALQLVSWVSATSRPFAPNDSLGVHQPVTGQTPQTLQATLGPELGPKQRNKGMEGGSSSNDSEEKWNARGVHKIGSSPPRCEDKCYGCIPCEAIQVPTTSSSHSRAGIQYANYEPEGWKCKCGPSFYSP